MAKLLPRGRPGSRILKSLLNKILGLPVFKSLRALRVSWPVSCLELCDNNPDTHLALQVDWLVGSSVVKVCGLVNHNAVYILSF